MAASSVVVDEESVKAAAAQGVVGPGSGVGPFGEQGPIEPFCLAVRPGTAGLGEASFQLPRRADPAPVGAAPIDQRIIGEYPAQVGSFSSASTSL